jgi:hypothetical protein
MLGNQNRTITSYPRRRRPLFRRVLLTWSEFSVTLLVSEPARTSEWRRTARRSFSAIIAIRKTTLALMFRL